MQSFQAPVKRLQNYSAALSSSGVLRLAKALSSGICTVSACSSNTTTPIGVALGARKDPALSDLLQTGKGILRTLTSLAMKASGSLPSEVSALEAESSIKSSGEKRRITRRSQHPLRHPQRFEPQLQPKRRVVRQSIIKSRTTGYPQAGVALKISIGRNDDRNTLRLQSVYHRFNQRPSSEKCQSLSAPPIRGGDRPA